MKTPLPDDLAEALRSAGLHDFFADCTAAHQNEYLKWINGANRPETRRTRIARAMKMIAAKRAEEEGKSR
jgi:uncharacterized protein YdeI (YjbR/CyaY-like superfamily)